MDRGKVIEGLKELQSYFRAMAGIASSEQGQANHIESARIIEDALALLKAQEPRVITLEEIRDVLKQPVWKETKSAHEKLYTGWVIAYDIQIGHGITGERLGMSEPSGRVVWYRLDDYGRTWRLWTSRPTDEQREATPWN